MASAQKRGFRLPWAGDGRPDAPDGSPDHQPDLDSEAEDTMDATMRDDARTPGASGTAPAVATTPPPPAGARDEDDSSSETSRPLTTSWPDSDRRTAASAPRPPLRVAGSPAAPRRANPLVAGLLKAMREATAVARDETLAAFRAEAAERGEVVRADGVNAAAQLREIADADIAGIRDWSKAEIARVREETEVRIAGRRSQLVDETDARAASTEEHVQRLGSLVESFESEMAGFFEQLLAETDPARLAGLAERMPPPPSLDDLEPRAGMAAATPEATEVEEADSALDSESAAAAEAEALASLGLPARRGAAGAPASGTPAAGGEPSDDDATRVVVDGLVSVAGIAAFKRALTAVDGVSAVSVTSGAGGQFVFAVTHDKTTDLAAALPALREFDAQVVSSDPSGLSVLAREPAA
jgi:hypothetical protein